MDEHKEIFDDKFGEINNYKVKLELKSEVKPVFCKVRTVLFTLKGQVEDKIDRLEKDGIIEKVESSESAKSVMPVIKPEGSIWLCADYSLTLNQKLIMPQHLVKIGRNIYWGKTILKTWL